MSSYRDGPFSSDLSPLHRHRTPNVLPSCSFVEPFSSSDFYFVWDWDGTPSPRISQPKMPNSRTHQIHPKNQKLERNFNAKNPIKLRREGGVSPLQDTSSCQYTHTISLSPVKGYRSPFRLSRVQLRFFLSWRSWVSDNVKIHQKRSKRSSCIYDKVRCREQWSLCFLLFFSVSFFCLFFFRRANVQL